MPTTEVTSNPMADKNAVVLIAEDEQPLADLYAEWLAPDYEVRIAYDGEEAMDRLDDAVDVVLLDRRMPGLSGDEVLARVRDRGYNCRVAMVTAVKPDFDIIELGFDDYLTKPASKEDLQSIVEELLTRADYDQTLLDYYALVATRAALDDEKSPAELDADPRYADLIEWIAEYEEQLDQVQDEMGPDDYAVAFRDLGAELEDKEDEST